MTTYYYDEGIGTKGHGFLAHEYKIPGQWGTHVDPPAHFPKGKRSLDDIPVKEMVLPLVIIDVSKKVEQNPDCQITMGDVQTWEAKYGNIPANSFVAIGQRSGRIRRRCATQMKKELLIIPVGAKKC